MRPLIAVKSCHKYGGRRDAQRRTWAAEVQSHADMRFFLGRGAPGAAPLKCDEVELGCGDGYLELPEKVRRIFEWALAKGYGHVFMADDDAYVQVGRLLASGWERHDYCGRLRGPSGGFPAPYCSGFGYWVSRRAMLAVLSQRPKEDAADDRQVGNALAQAGIGGRLDARYAVVACDQSKAAGHKGDPNEDRSVGNALLASGIPPSHDARYAVSKSRRNTPSVIEGPRAGNDLIATCEYEPADMDRVHQQWLSSPAQTAVRSLPEGPLSCVSVLIKTFLRDGYLSKCLDTLQGEMPEAKIVVVDDGLETRDKIARYARLRSEGHECLWLPYDSGFGAKANAAIPSLCKTEFALIGCDDFDFRGARRGVESMLALLRAKAKIGVASGRVNGVPYERMVTREGGVVTERPLGEGENLGEAGGVSFQTCDLTVNYSLIRTRIFKETGLHWCPEFKIGGDHYMFFKDLGLTQWRAAVVHGASVTTFPNVRHWRHPDYDKNRWRAIESLPAMFHRLGIHEWHGPTGREACDFARGHMLFYDHNGLSRTLKFSPGDLVTRCAECERRQP